MRLYGAGKVCMVSDLPQMKKRQGTDINHERVS
jgi:hypothetical protein